MTDCYTTAWDTTHLPRSGLCHQTKKPRIPAGLFLLRIASEAPPSRPVRPIGLHADRRSQARGFAARKPCSPPARGGRGGGRGTNQKSMPSPPWPSPIVIRFDVDLASPLAPGAMRIVNQASSAKISRNFVLRALARHRVRLHERRRHGISLRNHPRTRPPRARWCSRTYRSRFPRRGSCRPRRPGRCR